MVALVVLDKVFLAVKDPVAAVDQAGPVLARLVHPHFMLLPVRFRLEGFERLGFGTVGAEHEGVARLTGAPVCRKRGDAHVLVRGGEGFELGIDRAVHFGRGREGRWCGARGV